jgi:uncharacterized membrane protein
MRQDRNMMTKGRVEAFSDGVLAVAITLLVLDLKFDDSAGHASLAHQLKHNWPSYVAYAVSFIVIGVIWVNHHALFSLIAHVDRIFLFQNLVLLMFVTTMPFTTSTLAEFLRDGGDDARWAVVLYGVSNIGMSIGYFSMLHRMIHHGLLKRPVEKDVGRTALLKFGLGNVAYPVATGLGLLWPPLILVTTGSLAVYYMFEQTDILPGEDQVSARA